MNGYLKWVSKKDRVTLFFPKGSVKPLRMKALKENKSLSKYIFDLTEEVKI